MRAVAHKSIRPQRPVSYTRSTSNTARLSHRTNPILFLQRAIGNLAVQRMLRPDAEELNTRSDEYEREAENVSAQVMRMPDRRLSSACACGGECSECQSKKESGVQPSLQIRRASTAGAEATVSPPVVSQALSSTGRPFDPALKAYFEPRFGHDFSGVRIHTGPQASEAAREVDALAYTAGSDIVFGAGQYSPHTTAGRRLLAHELTHVIQRQAGDMQIRRKPAGDGDCPKRKPKGEVEASIRAPYVLHELSPKKEWVIHDFGVGVSKIVPGKGDIERLVNKIAWRLAEGHFIYVTGQDPVEVLGYADCHVDKDYSNERLRRERAANFCATLKDMMYAGDSGKSYDSLISSCRAAPEGEYVDTNSTPDGRSKNRSVLIRVLPPAAKQPTSNLPYDDKYGPAESNCLTYKSAAPFLSREYASNSYCACTHTPDEPHNNCVRKCLQTKLWDFLAANAHDLRAGRIIWCPTIYKHHVDCYSECTCDNSFIGFDGFFPMCVEAFGCQAVGLSIALLNKCMNK